ncbi:Leucine-rich repeat protein kinase family protein [Abeliophyllum distichum]|uniref:non-specific serine/threonine protein kinase n=1 Tax=Abeliophyllum distichum TaxID=126358 RepID=A0ABD1NRN7_9LAMI
MDSRILVCLLLISSQILGILALTDSNDLAALNAIKSSWSNLPPNWKGSDPCGSSWGGINCTDSRVTSIMLAGIGVEGSEFSDISSLSELQLLDLSNNIGLKGILPSSIGKLKKLSTLILVGCSFYGPIPDAIGSLDQLVFLSLNNNSLSGPIPSSIGNLTRLSWLDLSYNKLSDTIPVASATASGLDMLSNARHFHLSNNLLSGSIPDQLFSSNMKLIHTIFDHNQLSGNIPSTLGSVKTLEIIRLDWNFFDGSVPPNLSNLTNMNELYLSNNKFTGNMPNLTGMNFLHYVDLSNNSFDASGVPQWITSLQSLTTLMMENTQLQGQIPVDFFRLPQLETVVLSNNNVSGVLNIGNSYRNNLTLDLRNNSITDFMQKTDYNMELTLVNNPICNTKGATSKYCTVEKHHNTDFPSNNCMATSCSRDKVLSPNCGCSHPYTGTLHFFSFSFSDLQNLTYVTTLNGALMSVFLSNGLPVDSVVSANPTVDIYNYLQFSLQIFPSGQDSFNQTSISTIGFLLNRQPFQLQYYGPFFFIDEPYCCFAGSKKSSNAGIIIGVAVGCSVLVLLIIFAGIYAFFQYRKAKRASERNDPFASWDSKKGSGSVPQLQGAKGFSFEDLRKCTDNFSESKCIGSGGYGKVYKGAISSGQLVAIKRAQQGSMQGASEFKTEIELMSRIHHKNVVSLVGFCYDQGEQMLVYEYISNGTLRDSLSGKIGFRLDWNRRLKIALDAARGLSYLHELANPPIIHRDIKSNNILLDDHFNAKVADFGLSKLMGDTGKGYVTTQVKGTLGYMDPEYYMTQQLTEKSDVYSFGVVMLELITAKAPIEHGKHIVRAVQEAMGDPIGSENLDKILDPAMGLGSEVGGLKKFVNLAMSCVGESAADRPTMGEVVREIENILDSAPANKKMDTKFSRSSYEEANDESPLHSHDTEVFDVSYGSFPFHVEHQYAN